MFEKETLYTYCELDEYFKNNQHEGFFVLFCFVFGLLLFFWGECLRWEDLGVLFNFVGVFWGFLCLLLFVHCSVVFLVFGFVRFIMV